jgi:hypothetical protein
VLEHAYEQVDYVSAHAYYEKVENDLASSPGWDRLWQWW